MQRMREKAERRYHKWLHLYNIHIYILYGEGSGKKVNGSEWKVERWTGRWEVDGKLAEVDGKLEEMDAMLGKWIEVGEGWKVERNAWEVFGSGWEDGGSEWEVRGSG